MTVTITKAMAYDALVQSVEERGENYVYENKSLSEKDCVYTDNLSQPSCIVGYALAKVGVPLNVLHAIDWGIEVDGKTYSDVETSIGDVEVTHWLLMHGYDINADALKIFSIAQAKQDMQYTWGTAVREALDKTGGFVK